MINTIIFDIGNVLLDWNPRHLYKKLIGNEEEMEWFLSNICTLHWNEGQDAGRTLKDATDYLVNLHPTHEANVRAYYGRWEEMISGELSGTVDILRKLRESGKYKLYALSNWSAETFVVVCEQYEFFKWFDGLVVSGIENDVKPNPSFYQLLLDRYKVDPQKAIFIDDRMNNIVGAERVGLHTIQFTSAENLVIQLLEKGVEIKIQSEQEF